MTRLFQLLVRLFRRTYIHKSYRIRGNPDAVFDELIILFQARGLVKTGFAVNGRKAFFRYPSVFFSTRRPLTCVSDLTLETRGIGRETEVRLGATFVKVRYFILLTMSFIWVGLPLLVGLLRSSLPDFSPFGVLIVPTGVLLHYSIRGRVFRHLRRLVHRVEETNGVH